MKCIKCGMLSPDAMYCCHCGASQMPSPSLESVYNNWKVMHYRRIGAKTREGYEAAWRHLQVYKSRPIDTIQYLEWQYILDSNSTLSVSYLQKIRLLIGQLIQYAVIIHNLKIPDYTKHLVIEGKKGDSREIFSDNAISQLFFYAQGNDEYARTARIILLLICTGCRPNELFAVKKKDVNLEQMYILLPGSKTTAGKNRIMPIVPLIQKMVFAFYFEYPDSDYLIATAYKHTHILLNNWRRRDFYFLMQMMEINPPDDPHRIVPYSCRHTYATLAKRAHVEPNALVKMIGHTSYTTTEKFYIHERLTEYRDEMNKVNNILDTIISDPQAGEGYNYRRIGNG